jgi:hypothetical protein
MESKMTLFIKSMLRSPRAQAFVSKRWGREVAPNSPHTMHETKRRILRKLIARMKAEQSFVT